MEEGGETTKRYPLHFQEGIQRWSRGAAPGQTLMYFPNARPNSHSNLVHKQNIAGVWGRSPRSNGDVSLTSSGEL